MRVYIDGVFDLFHVGHLESLRAALRVASETSEPELYVGVVSDEDAASYKRVPIIAQEHRAQIVGAIRGVTRVIVNCPLVVTPEFLDQHGIDLVVHGFANDADRERQKPFFSSIQGRFREIPYTQGVSTSNLIQQLKNCA